MSQKSIIPIGSRDRVINERVIKISRKEEGEKVEITISKTANNRAGRRKKKKKG